jgi:hypothetical protein
MKGANVIADSYLLSEYSPHIAIIYLFRKINIIEIKNKKRSRYTRKPLSPTHTKTLLLKLIHKLSKRGDEYWGNCAGTKKTGTKPISYDGSESSIRGEKLTVYVDCASSATIPGPNGGYTQLSYQIIATIAGYTA